MPKISVILPVFNAAPFLDQAIDSILQQQFSDLEIIAINDGSQDASLQILETRAAENPAIKIVSRENRGIVFSLNEGIQLASGEWIARMDADDIAHPDRLGSQLAFAEENNLALLGSAIHIFGDIDYTKPFPVSDADIRHSFHIQFYPFSHPTILAKRAVFERYSYDDRYQSAEDLALWMSVINDRSFKLGNHPSVLLDYRQHQRQVSHSLAEQQRLTTLIIMKESMEKLGLACTDYELDLHCRSHLRKSEGHFTVQELRDYGSFLLNLNQQLGDKFGPATIVAEHWQQTTKRYRKLKARGLPKIPQKEASRSRLLKFLRRGA